uniref:NADH-ubiquinone oxidoreductase chain 2 n=1 Tax=Pharyngocirrus uchidai TaxID=2498818 RepID=A0A7G9IX11_9ANNE|nr:NADH dehydrogenase subunit 2 [Pharyngocirrus uchidai]QNM39905.1 NADH dehydrogenase subunit 2 [Pharyngocirrus uchidai]
MLLTFSYPILFMPILFMTTLAALSASNWYILWLFLEINLLCFVPIIISSHSNPTAEASVKYFLAQATGSILLLTAAISMTASDHISPMFSGALLISSIALKLGMPPAHFWFPSVMAAMSWINCLLLSTWQKIAPLFIMVLAFSPLSRPIIFGLAGLAALVGGLGGLNQTQLRPLLAYSSMGHMGWMVAASMVSVNSMVLYFASYIAISTPLMLPLHKFNSFSKAASSNILSIPLPLLAPTLILLLSLGGLPPLMGFFPKWIVLQALVASASLMVLLSLILGSLMNLFYYLTVVFSISMSSSSQSLLNTHVSTATLFLPMMFSLPLIPISLALLT